MTLVYILLSLLFLGLFIFYRVLTRMIKYQNFKSNVILRLALKEEMEQLAKLEDSDLDYTRMGYRDDIVKKISKAIDEEIDNTLIEDWRELITAIRASGFFQTELSEPFHRAFYPTEIVKRHNERNKEFIPSARK